MRTNAGSNIWLKLHYFTYSVASFYDLSYIESVYLKDAAEALFYHRKYSEMNVDEMLKQTVISIFYEKFLLLLKFTPVGLITINDECKSNFDSLIYKEENKLCYITYKFGNRFY